MCDSDECVRIVLVDGVAVEVYVDFSLMRWSFFYFICVFVLVFLLANDVFGDVASGEQFNHEIVFKIKI